MQPAREGLATEWVELDSLQAVVSVAAAIVEAVGVATILFGAVVALVLVLLGRRAPHAPSPYATYRRYLGRAILLGLEFLVAADIIRTVSHIPSLEDVAVLGAIVLIRTFLSFTLEVELEGRWPWKRTEHSDSAPRG